MSEPSEKLDMKSLNEALEVNAETDNPADVKGPEEQARETMSKSNTLTAAPSSTQPSDSPATLSPGSPSRSPVLETTSIGPTSTVASPRPEVSQTVDRSDTSPTDPTVQQIKSMFPDLDTDTIQAVVVAEDGDFERAINMLLQMSDPTYVPPPPFRRTSQTEQDEQLARTLAADEEHQARTQQHAVQPSGRGGALGSFFGMGASGVQEHAPSPSYDPNNLAYKPRVRRTASGQAQVPPAAPQQPTPYSSQPPRRASQTEGSAAGGDSGGAAWPGPKEAKQWQEDINKLAETGFARAASTFSAIRQRSEQAWAARSQPSPGNGPADGYNSDGRANSAGRGGIASAGRGNSFFGGWSQRNAGDRSGQSSISPTIGSSRGFDRDPSPVGDNELAKILARGRNNRSSSGSDGYQIDGANETAQRKSNLSSITDRYKKVAQAHRGGHSSNTEEHDEVEHGSLSWDDAGRTGASGEKRSFEPIKISDNSSGSSIDGKHASATPSAQERNAVSLMEGSGGRGITSSASAGTGTSALTDRNVEHNEDRNDSEGDDDDLEYVANPFEDED